MIFFNIKSVFCHQKLYEIFYEDKYDKFHFIKLSFKIFQTRVIYLISKQTVCIDKSIDYKIACTI